MLILYLRDMCLYVESGFTVELLTVKLMSLLANNCKPSGEWTGAASDFLMAFSSEFVRIPRLVARRGNTEAKKERPCHHITALVATFTHTIFVYRKVYNSLWCVLQLLWLIFKTAAVKNDPQSFEIRSPPRSRLARSFDGRRFLLVSFQPARARLGRICRSRSTGVLPGLL
jgi:hypothetical protein